MCHRNAWRRRKLALFAVIHRSTPYSLQLAAVQFVGRPILDSGENEIDLVIAAGSREFDLL